MVIIDTFAVMKKLQEMKQTKNVAQSNAITNGYSSYTKLESDLMIVLLAQLKPNELKYRVSVKDLLKHTKVLPSNYKSIIEALHGLFEKVLTLKHSEDRITHIRLLSLMDYSKTNVDSYIDIMITKPIAPYLLQLKARFTVFETKAYLQLNSTYSKKLYQLFAEFKTTGVLILSCDEIQKLLGVNYVSFGRVLEKIITPSIEEIITTTNINNIKLHPIKEGRKIVAYKFTFNWQPQQLEIPILATSTPPPTVEVYEQLVSIYQLSNKQATIICEAMPLKEIKMSLRSIQLQRDNIKNISAYTVTLFQKRNGITF